MRCVMLKHYLQIIPTLRMHELLELLDQLYQKLCQHTITKTTLLRQKIPAAGHGANTTRYGQLRARHGFF